MMLFERLKKTFVFSAFLCLCPVLGYADVSCPSGYVKISEPDSIIVTNASSCPSGHTKLSDMSGNTSVTNCTTGLSSGFCTYYSEPCQSGKYFDGTTHKTCIAGSYCDGSGTATPGVSGCSKACPENSTSTSGATKCTCNTGYEMIGGACVLKTCESGYYLNGDDCEICPVGSYCANNIKTACDDGYTTDATGSTSESQCYTTCEQQCTQQACPDNATCTHGTAITTGKQYVGGTCNAEQTMCGIDITCDTGYNKTDSGIEIVEKTPLIPVDYHEYGDGGACVDADGNPYNYNLSDAGLTENNTWASHFDYGTVYGRASCQPTMDEGFMYIMVNLETVMGGDMALSEFESGLAAISGTAKAKYASNSITELQSGTKTVDDLTPALWAVFGTETDANYSTSSSGQYCYCQMTGFTPTGGTKQSVAGASWVFAGDCADDCARSCANWLRGVGPGADGFRAAVFGSLRVESDAMCIAKMVDVPAGHYLPANTTEPVQCPKNNYCPGMVGATLHETQNQGLTPCPNTHPNSEAGATSETQCYTTCTKQCTQQTCPENATCTHVTAITTGKQYVGGTCDAEQTMCEVNFECNENFELVDGECKFKPEFTITTINMSDDTTFMFALSAAGNYVIDWGDGNVELINKTDTARESVWHTYKKGGIYTIGLSGQATKYSDVEFIAAIDFGNNTAEVVQGNAYKYIAAIDGSLGAIFSGSTANMFYKTFSGCSYLTTIPKTLFDGVTGNAEYMFANTFFECTNLKTLPENLFAGLYGSAEHMFDSTFARCSALENIPKDLFAAISGNALNLFSYTFSYCSALRSIPEELFSSLSGNAMCMFEYTFFNCTSLTEIPKGLFASLSGGATGMFAWTFSYCRNLTSIPSELFATITDSWESMFYMTFGECTSLQSIPGGLFKNITGKPKYQEFDGVFRGCTNLSGYIPVDMFEKLDATDFNNSSMWGIFDGTKLATRCPANMYQIITGFESAWGDKVMCGTCPDGTLSIAGAVGIESCKNVEPVEVVITTTEMQADSNFIFYISASGTFFVDWGDGTIELIDHTVLRTNQYKHKYLVPGVYKIGLSGNATGYTDSYCVGFMGNQYVNEVDGSLIDIFGILPDGTNPKFTYTFTGCSNLSKISKDLFAGYNGGTEQMFYSTFTSTYSLKEIPEGLFDSITTAAPDMFNITFASSGLTSLPSGMFKNITGKPEPNMFRSTFAAVNDLQGYVPANMFENMDSVDYESGPMSAIFYGTNLAEQCPENMYQYKTGFEVDWSGKVACTPCPAGTTSFAGASGIEQCTGPKSLHIGDDIQMNLITVKPQTARVMVFDVLGELYYGGLSDTPKSINKNTDKQFRILDGDTSYWMHDYTVK